LWITYGRFRTTNNKTMNKQTKTNQKHRKMRFQRTRSVARFGKQTAGAVRERINRRARQFTPTCGALSEIALCLFLP
jgi:hypothetical protein